MDKIALIVAGGAGTRMKASIPKQFMLLDHSPVLMHTLKVFREYDRNIRLILVLPDDQFAAWDELCREYKFDIVHELGSGGKTRFHSVKKNIRGIPDDSLVGIHDGVRPLVSLQTIDRCYNGAMERGNAVPCIEIPETLRLIEDNRTIQVDRSRYRLVQTPQVFRGDILKSAYLQDFQESFTDDAGVVESAGYTIHLVEGNPENIKITYRKDLIIATAMLRS